MEYNKINLDDKIKAMSDGNQIVIKGHTVTWGAYSANMKTSDYINTSRNTFEDAINEIYGKHFEYNNTVSDYKILIANSIFTEESFIPSLQFMRDNDITIVRSPTFIIDDATFTCVSRIVDDLESELSKFKYVYMIDCAYRVDPFSKTFSTVNKIRGVLK